MMSFKSVFKKNRPLMGTFLRIELTGESSTQDTDSVLDEAFGWALELEARLSLFQESSEITKFNNWPTEIPFAASPLFCDLLERTVQLWTDSQGAFNPFFPARLDFRQPPLSFNWGANQFLVTKNQPVRVDLSGIAKGFTVDQIVDRLQKAPIPLSGCVNAGGDLRFFQTEDKVVEIRMGPSESPFVRRFQSPAESIATSAVHVSLDDSCSSSRYHLNFRKGLTPDHTITVAADNCETADAFTKIALYGVPEVVSRCARKWNCHIMVFNPRGDLQEVYGPL